MPRRDTTTEYRRSQVARRYLQGEMQSVIAESFGVDQAQISRDLRVIRATWLASAIRDFDEARAQELAKIDVVEREYWAAWQRSQENKEVEFEESGPKGRRSGSRSEGQSGNPAYLAGVLACIDKRCQILGLDAPRRFVVKWEDLTDEQIDRLAAGDPPERVLSA